MGKCIFIDVSPHYLGAVLAAGGGFEPPLSVPEVTCWVSGDVHLFQSMRFSLANRPKGGVDLPSCPLISILFAPKLHSFQGREPGEIEQKVIGQ